MKYNQPKKIYAFIASILVLMALACGNSITERLESELSPTATNESPEITEETAVNTSVEPTSTQEPEPVATESQPTNTVEPTEVSPTEIPPTPTLEPEPTPAPEDIAVVSYGFGQDNRSVGYSFIVENPNSGLSFERSQYQLAALDESGAIVDTDSGFISLLLPDQTLGVSGSFFVDEGVTVASINVQLNAGDSETAEPIATFTVENPTYFAGSFSSSVTGVIGNPYERDLSNVRVSAVAYNAADEIVGGGFTFLNFVLANSTTGVDVSVTTAGEVARVELYPTISGLTFLGTESELPEDATIVNIINHGYGQEDRSAGFGLVLENSNNAYSIENSEYHVTLFAEDGTVIGVEEGFINLLLPSQVLGVGGDIFLDEGQIASHIEVQYQVGDYVAVTEELLPFTSENAVFSQGSFSSQVTGFIVNPYSQNITTLRVSAIAYNESGEIIGGGFTFLDFAIANGQSPVEVSVTTSGVPATVEIYATLSSLSDFE